MWKFKKNMRRDSGDIYMVRWHLLKTRLLSIYINHIRLPDSDPWLHTHPWRKSWSIKLRGRYLEEIATEEKPAAYYCRWPGFFSRIPEQHRILIVPSGGALTLFIGWRSDRPWGFVNPETGEVVDWKTRVKMRGMTPEESRR